MSVSPFKIAEWITTKVKPAEVETSKDGYNSFIINRYFSYFPDLVFFANEINKRENFSSDLDLQFDFYYHVIKKQKRFTKWVKPKKDDDIEVIMEFYSYSREKAKQVIDLFNKKELDKLRTQLKRGGINKNK